MKMQTSEQKEDAVLLIPKRRKKVGAFLKANFEPIKYTLVLLAIPLIFTLVFSAVYSGVYVQEIPLAVLDLDHSATSRSLIENFEKSAGFRVAYYVNTQDELKNDLLSERIETGFIIPDGFGKEIKSKKSPSVLFLMDGTNIVIGNSAYSYASTILSTISAGVQLQYLEGGGIVGAEAESALKTLSFADRVLYEPKASYFTFTFAGFLAIFIQQTFMSVMGPIFVEEKLTRRAMGASKGKNSLLTKLISYTALNFVGALLSVIAAHLVGGYPVKGSVLLMLLLQAVFIAGLLPMTLLIASFNGDKASCAQFVMFMSIPTLLTSGVIWPVFNMPPFLLNFIKCIWPMYYYVLPIREVMLKGAGLPEIWKYLVGGLMFAAIWTPITYLLYRKSCQVPKSEPLIPQM
jgi:ABC-2 type transport system permease protein